MNINKLIQRSDAYLESAGHFDKPQLAESVQAGGEAAAVRICLGASESMPLRALSLVVCGLATIEQFLPEAQLQIVHPLHAAEQVNGRDFENSRRQAMKLRDVTKGMIAAHCPRFEDKVTFGLDNPDDLGFLAETSAITGAIQAKEALTEKLHQQAASNGGDAAQYVAAHLLMHDSKLPIMPLGSGDPQAVEPAMLISLGAQNEHVFYAARMACRQADVEIPDPIERTGQLFSRHVLPPYMTCRQGEPHVSEFRHLRRAEPHAVASVQRDLDFLRSFVRAQIMQMKGEAHE